MGLFDFIARLLGGAEPSAQATAQPAARGGAARQPRRRLRATAEHDPGRLAALGLPNLATRDELARAMGIERRELDWLSAPDPDAQPRHYVAFAVPKATGGYRVLYAPKTRTKMAQRWILRNILDYVPLPTSVHGFVPGRSIHTNAQEHTGQDIVLTLDLEDFFPSITYRRVRGVFQAIGYGEDVAVPLALLCTVKPAEEVREFLGGRRHRMLPQGAPTSPALANLTCRKLDARLAGLAARFGCAYTRYADDLAFSGDVAFVRSLKRFIPLLRRIVRSEDFVLNRAKMRFARRGASQRVTGLVVNDRPSVPRRYRRTLRAILHNARRTGLAAQNLTNHPSFEQSLRGQLEFVRATHPELAARMLAELDALPR